MTEAEKPAQPLAPIAGIAGAASGWGLSHYCGLSIWIPGATLILLLMLFHKGAIRPKYFPGAIAFTAGHVVWFTVASIFGGIWSATAGDIAALSIGIAWLWLRPGISSALFLGVIQLASLAFNVYTISSVEIGSPEHRALTAHCFLRLGAIAFLIAGYVRMRREQIADLR